VQQSVNSDTAVLSAPQLLAHMWDTSSAACPYSVGMETRLLLGQSGFRLSVGAVDHSRLRHLETGSVVHPATLFNPLTPELNPSPQRCLARFFTGDFASWTVHFVNTCVKNQQMQQLFIQVLHVSALHFHLQGEFLVPSEICSIEEQSIEYCGWACCV
jgi:hypothetical protein